MYGPLCPDLDRSAPIHRVLLPGAGKLKLLLLYKLFTLRARYTS